MQGYTIDQLIKKLRDHQIKIATGAMTGMNNADMDAHYDAMFDVENEIKKRVKENES